MTAVEFSRRMGVTCETALKWLNQGIVPGAALKDRGLEQIWDIPEAALQMERPKRKGGFGAMRVKHEAASDSPPDKDMLKLKS